MADITIPKDLAAKALVNLVRYGTHEEFDCPGDKPESCGWWCDICNQHIDDDDRRKGHDTRCVIDRLKLELAK